MQDKINELSQKLGLPVKKIYDIFYYLSDGLKVDNLELIRKTGIAKNTINSVKEYFKDIFGQVSTTTQINQKILPSLENIFKHDYLPDESLLNLTAKNDVQDIFSERVTPLRKYDQFTATPETVVKRASLLNHFNDINNKRLLFLGDDDFTSITVTMLGKPTEIIVLDVDDRILDKIKSISDKLSLNIKTIKHDLAKVLPNDLLNRFDVVFTDPPYTSEGVRLFLSRAISSLDRKNMASRIYLCYGNSDRAKERYLPIYKFIIDSGLMLRYVFDKFNRYFGAESIGCTSSMFVLDVTPKVKIIIKGDYDNPIYTND
ncbi:MAG: bis-aminopropyl spermidine synthase family protein [bacterium]|nr:bis-aminopropyl spermidine synthase family protein [bacterium]